MKRKEREGGWRDSEKQKRERRGREGRREGRREGGREGGKKKEEREAKKRCECTKTSPMSGSSSADVQRIRAPYE